MQCTISTSHPVFKKYGDLLIGCCPTEEELQEILVTVEDHETSSVRLTTFLPVVTKIITERK